MADPRRTEVPQTILAADNLPSPAYTCAFELASPGAGVRSAEAWLRAMFEDAHPALRAFIVSGWIGALRLRLGPRPSPDHVIGWKILSTTHEEIVIGVESPLVSAHQVLQVSEGTVTHVTLVHFERSVAKVVWGVAAPIHVRTIPHLMRRAATGV